MNRITMIENRNANPEQKGLLDSIERQLGAVPNYLRVLANSPAALKAFLGLHRIAGEGSLTPQTRERIALALAQQNACAYDLSAHIASGRESGLTGDEMAANREGCSEDARALVAVKLARRLAECIGEISTAELVEARAAGYTDADIVEIVTHVGLNLLTNTLSNASRVEIDFPKITP